MAFGLEDGFQALQNAKREFPEIRPPVVHGRPVDGPQYAVRNVAGPRNLQKVASASERHGFFLPLFLARQQAGEA